ncbi:hypothetical protein LL974_18060 [Xanthomonas campestris pv. cannae]|nr:hypothetical protein [Xanthomonas campestris pv. cannae]
MAALSAPAGRNRGMQEADYVGMPRRPLTAAAPARATVYHRLRGAR